MGLKMSAQDEFEEARKNWEYFNKIREELLEKHRGKAVVVTRGKYIVASSLEDALEQAKEEFPDLVHTIEWGKVGEGYIIGHLRTSPKHVVRKERHAETPEEKLLYNAASVEYGSEHPIAKAIVDEAKKGGIKLDRVESFEVIPGVGVKGLVGGKEVFVGKPSILSSNKEKSKKKKRLVVIVKDVLGQSSENSQRGQ
jgi:hypothetical protein